MNFLNYLRTSVSTNSKSKVSDQKILASMMVMAWMVEARDPYTGGHLWRVSRFSKLLARNTGLLDSEVARITIGGFLHDLGKVGIPDAILNKKDKLTDDEYEIVKTHPSIGKRMLIGHPFSSLALDAIFHHHEQPDGKGYPLGLKSEQIPIAAKMIGICDAFDAMTSTRPYRKGMPITKAIAIIQSNLGAQFDPKLGELFIKLAESSELNHIVGHTDEGIPLFECLMCGPTVVIQKNTKFGDITYCRSCGSEYKLDSDDTQLKIVPTGKTGSATALEAKYDMHQIDELVAESMSAITK